MISSNLPVCIGGSSQQALGEASEKTWVQASALVKSGAHLENKKIHLSAQNPQKML